MVNWTMCKTMAAVLLLPTVAAIAAQAPQPRPEDTEQWTPEVPLVRPAAAASAPPPSGGQPNGLVSWQDT